MDRLFKCLKKNLMNDIPMALPDCLSFCDGISTDSGKKYVFISDF